MTPYVLLLFTQLQGQHLHEVKRIKNIPTIEQCADVGHNQVLQGKDLRFICFPQDTYFKLPKW